MGNMKTKGNPSVQQRNSGFSGTGLSKICLKEYFCHTIDDIHLQEYHFHRPKSLVLER